MCLQVPLLPRGQNKLTRLKMKFNLAYQKAECKNEEHVSAHYYEHIASLASLLGTPVQSNTAAALLFFYLL